MTVDGWDLGQMQHMAFDLGRLSLAVETSAAHPDGKCRQEYVRCPGCTLLAPLEPGYCGSTVGSCRLCGYSWQVIHHPEFCWH